LGTSIFITGHSGFVGRHLLGSHGSTKYQNIYGLSRGKVALQNLSARKNVRSLSGSLRDSSLYAPYLASSDVVLHLAACTGKAAPDDYFAVNTQGTKLLVEQCRQLGVDNFLYVSSIAVTYADKSRYYYAQSKQQAEDVVRQSGLNYTILRPTIVLGKDAPLWQNLLRLAKPPIILLFGDGRARIQPLFIDDLVESIFAIIDQKMFSNQTIDLGGAEVVTIEGFLTQVHRVLYKKQPKVIHLPLKYLTPFLSLAERAFSFALPFNVGQLSLFTNDGVAQPNFPLQSRLPHMKDIPTMLQLLLVDR
jgi:nucleoside-diphosphate-sugar epimerase